MVTTTPSELTELREIPESQYNTIRWQNGAPVPGAPPVNARAISSVICSGVAVNNTDIGLIITVNPNFDAVKSFANGDVEIKFAGEPSYNAGRTRYFLVSLLRLNPSIPPWEVVVSETDPDNDTSNWTFVKSRIPIDQEKK